MARDSFLKTAAPLVVLTAFGVYNLPQKSNERPAEAAASYPSVHYRYCSDVRAAGKAPLYAGQPGYASHLDRDGDGVACEPHF